MKRVFLSFFLFLFTLPTAFAQDGDHIRKYDVEVEISADSKVKVLEKIQYDFNGRKAHGIFRIIPLFYGDQNVEIPLEIMGITDGNGNDYDYEEINSLYGKEFKIGDADILLEGPHWYYIEYESEFLVDAFDDHDEFYWNVTGNDWDAVIDHANAKITVPGGGVKNSKYATCYTGYFGSDKRDCSSTVLDDRTFEFSTKGALGVGEGFTIVAAMEKGLVDLPAFLELRSNVGADLYLNGEHKGYGMENYKRLAPGHYLLEVKTYKYDSEVREVDLFEGETLKLDIDLKKPWYWVFVDTYLPIILFLCGFFFVLRLWWKEGRDPRGRGTIMPFYKPTDGLSPGEMGVVVDEFADLKDITATIVKLANKGFLRIEKRDKEYFFVKLKDLSDSILTFEKSVFEGLFESGALSVGMKKVRKSFYKNLELIKNELYEQVVAKGYFLKSPEQVRVYYRWKAFSWFLILGILSFLSFFLFVAPLYLLICLVGLEMFVLAFYMPRKTRLGVEVYERVLGYSMFLYTAEKDRLEKLFSPKEYAGVFSDNLPYAIVLGLERLWADQFKSLYDGVPDWYVAGGVNNLSSFIDDFANFQASSQTAYAGNIAGADGEGSSGAWGGGSGFGGGGFSGGGFGGGGGGSW